MKFNGDLSKYHPADAIMFLSQLNLNGVLSVTEQERLITLSFDNGFIVDAHSARGDAKILQGLIFNRKVSADQVKRIRQIERETHLPIRTILTQLDLFPLASVKEVLLTGMQEVLLEMFLLDAGAFHFTDTPIEADIADTRLDARMIAISIAAQSDEHRDFIKTIISLDREFSLAADGGQPAGDLPAEERVVMQLAASCTTIGDILDKAPFDSGTVVAILKSQIEAGALNLAPLRAEAPPAATESGGDPLFASFRRALKNLMHSDDPLKRIEALVAFCKGFYDGILILTAKQGQLVHCKQLLRKGQGLDQRSTSGSLGALEDEPVLIAVHRSGVSFFGNRFASALLDRFSGASETGECALIPVVNKGQVAVFIYAFNRNGFSGRSPQHYLELLSWMVTSRLSATAGPAMKVKSIDRPDPAEPAAPSGAEQLVAKIHELPPLPSLVTQALDMLSDPEVDIQAVTEVIGKDQSLVTKLIKISNSALFGGLQRVDSLHQALARLGAKTTRSLVLSASMQTYFFKSNPGMRTWGQFLWQHSVECGVAAKRIAAATGFKDAEQAFVGGVLHDIGKLVLLMVDADAYRQVQNLKKRDALCDHDAERRVVNTDHTEIGVLLMEKWKMPASARACVKFHHQADMAGEDRHLAEIIAYADHLSHLHGSPLQWFVADPETTATEMAEALNLTEQANATLVDAVIADYAQADML